MPKTRIYVSKSGKILIEGIGYSGNACIEDLQKLLEEVKKLGVNAEIEMHRKKPEANVVQEGIQNVQ